MSNRALFPDRGDGITVASAATSLPFPPVVFGDADDWSQDLSVLPVFEVEIWAAAATELTDTTLYGGVELDLTIAADNVDTVDFANNELDIATHGLETGDGPLQLTTTTTLPAGLSLLTDYYVIKTNAGTIQLATTFANAIAGTAVAFTDAGTGTHTLTGTGTESRVKWLSYGKLGPANDGVVSLTEKGGYVTKVDHRPRTRYYAISATLGTAVATTVTLHAVQELS